MNNQEIESANIKEKVVEVADVVVCAFTNRHLKDVEIAIIEGSCHNWNYEQIAQY
ncbi:MAG: hypothetical protein QNJ54_31585 [Prochloraceae cyanobacterium]|nr:hypothetical protein [Prochloraceae cyanobacterium]